MAFKMKLPESSITVRRIFGKEDMVVAQVVMNAVQRWDAQGIQKQKPVEAGCEMLYVVEADVESKVKATLLYVDQSITPKQLGLIYGEAPPVPAKPKGEPEKVTGPADKGIEDLAGKLFELLGKSDFDEIAKMTASDFQYKDMRYGTSWDFARFRAEFVEEKSVMSELVFKVNQVIAVGSYVLVRYIMEAQYAVGSGEDKKIVPIAIHGADVLEFRDGKLAQMEVYTSEMELNSQISRVEAPGPDASVSRANRSYSQILSPPDNPAMETSPINHPSPPAKISNPQKTNPMCARQCRRNAIPRLPISTLPEKTSGFVG